MAEVHFVGQEEEHRPAQFIRSRGGLDDVIVQFVQSLRVVAVDDEDDGVGPFVVVTEQRSLQRREGQKEGRKEGMKGRQAKGEELWQRLFV